MSDTSKDGTKDIRWKNPHKAVFHSTPVRVRRRCVTWSV